MVKDLRNGRQTPHSAVRVKGVVGELRQDLVTGAWVVMAQNRARRPHNLIAQRLKPKPLPKFKDDCPFCRLDKFPQQPDVVRLPDDPDAWQVHIFGNKYPAFMAKDEFRSWRVGPYRAIEAVGYHEVLATRWHNQIDGVITVSDLSLQLEALVLRYRMLRAKPSVNYIQIIKNHGQEAGGSLQHPHHQIITVPVLPGDIADLLHGTERYWRQYRTEPYEIMLRYERETGERVVFENEDFTAFCPYAPRFPFEVWIVPRRAEPFFENIGPTQRTALAEALLSVLRRLYVGLHDPPYNYYILSAPCDETGFVCNREVFAHFRWHIKILPRLGVWGGFELGTGLEITTILPEVAASFLRSQNIN